MRNRLIMALTALVLFLAGVLSACSAQPSPSSSPTTSASNPTSIPQAKPIELKMVTALAITHEQAMWGIEYGKIVAQKSNGQVVIKVMGGPDAIPVDNQVEALKTGVVDFTYNVAGYNLKQAPDFQAISLSRCATPAEERTTGFFDYLQNRFNKVFNAYYLGRACWGTPFYMWLTDSVTTPKEIAGKKIRATSTSAPLAQALGAQPVNIGQSEIYTSLERGVIKGLVTPVSSVYDGGFAEQAKYLIAHPFYNTADQLLVNLDSWNKIPKPLQELMISVAKDRETAASAHFTSWQDGQIKEMQTKNGLKLITFSAADAKYFVDTAYSAAWAEAAKTLDAATVTELKKLTKN